MIMMQVVRRRSGHWQKLEIGLSLATLSRFGISSFDVGCRRLSARLEWQIFETLG
jgi:hypothetical protein